MEIAKLARVLLCILLPAFLTSAPLAFAQTVPSVAGISGAVLHNGVVSISGTNFGIKSVAAPVLFDNFDDGTSGSFISAAAGWSEIGYSGVQKPKYDSTVKHAGTNSMKLFWNDSQSACSVKKYGNFAQEFYLDGWLQYDQEDGPPWSRVVKLLLLFGDGALEYPQIHFGTANCTQDEIFHVAGYADETTPTDNVYGFRLTDVVGSFHHMQLWLKASTSGQHNGAVRLWFDGRLIASSDAYLTVAGNQGFWNHVRLGYYHAHDGIPNICAESPGDAYGWWDDVYIDNTQARVEIGNASTYAASTHREIQIPSVWSQNSVQVRVNKGSFPSGQAAWLYVTNSAGASNAQGYPITFGGGDSLAPGVPHNLQVQP